MSLPSPLKLSMPPRKALFACGMLVIGALLMVAPANSDEPAYQGEVRSYIDKNYNRLDGENPGKVFLLCRLDGSTRDFKPPTIIKSYNAIRAEGRKQLSDYACSRIAKFLSQQRHKMLLIAQELPGTPTTVRHLYDIHTQEPLPTCDPLTNNILGKRVDIGLSCSDLKERLKKAIREQVQSSRQHEAQVARRIINNVEDQDIETWLSDVAELKSYIQGKTMDTELDFPAIMGLENKGLWSRSETEQDRTLDLIRATYEQEYRRLYEAAVVEAPTIDKNDITSYHHRYQYLKELDGGPLAELARRTGRHTHDAMPARAMEKNCGDVIHAVGMEDFLGSFTIEMEPDGLRLDQVACKAGLNSGADTSVVKQDRSLHGTSDYLLIFLMPDGREVIFETAETTTTHGGPRRGIVMKTGERAIAIREVDWENCIRRIVVGDQGANCIAFD